MMTFNYFIYSHLLSSFLVVAFFGFTLRFWRPELDRAQKRRVFRISTFIYIPVALLIAYQKSAHLSYDINLITALLISLAFGGAMTLKNKDWAFCSTLIGMFLGMHFIWVKYVGEVLLSFSILR